MTKGINLIVSSYISKICIGVCLLISMAGCVPSSDTPPTLTSNPPNIIIIYADDLGYGDVGIYGATGVQTPNIDALAAQGVLFTDAHATSAICTPSRYSLLTGEYGFRRQAQILKGDDPAIIHPDKPTLASLLNTRGYQSAVIGKWHLGLGNGDVDWNAAISPGPLDIGFDYAFIMPATGDRVPTAYLENRHLVNLQSSDPIRVSYGDKIGDAPTGMENPDLLRYGADGQHSQTIVNGISRIGYQDGGTNALWVDEEFPDIFTDKAVKFMRQNADNPFFLFYSLHDIHVPRLPHTRFLGQSEMGLRGDVIVQMDWMVGEIMKEVRALGLEDNTLVIFTSDNGPVLDDGYQDGAVERLGDHRPAGVFRGGKYSTLEGGARVPMIVSGPTVKAGFKSDAVMSQIDFYASFADVVGADLSPDVAIDSESHLEALLGKSNVGRDCLFKEGFTSMSLRCGDFKYIPPAPIGDKEPAFIKRDKNIESGWSPSAQLYNLKTDFEERQNIAPEHLDMTTNLQQKLDAILTSDRAQRGAR